MVLADLGSKVAVALRKMTQATVIDQTVINEMLAEICKALLQADVNVAQVKHLREQIKKEVDVESMASGMNKRKLLEQAVCNELCKMLNPGKEPYVPKKKQPNVIMFVGLQGCGKTTTCSKYAYLYKRKGFNWLKPLPAGSKGILPARPHFAQLNRAVIGLSNDPNQKSRGCTLEPALRAGSALEALSLVLIWRRP